MKFAVFIKGHERCICPWVLYQLFDTTKGNQQYQNIIIPGVSVGHVGFLGYFCKFLYHVDVVSTYHHWIHWRVMRANTYVIINHLNPSHTLLVLYFTITMFVVYFKPIRWYIPSNQTILIHVLCNITTLQTAPGDSIGRAEYYYIWITNCIIKQIRDVLMKLLSHLPSIHGSSLNLISPTGT